MEKYQEHLLPWRRNGEPFQLSHQALDVFALELSRIQDRPRFAQVCQASSARIDVLRRRHDEKLELLVA